MWHDASYATLLEVQRIDEDTSAVILTEYAKIPEISWTIEIEPTTLSGTPTPRPLSEGPRLEDIVGIFAWMGSCTANEKEWSVEWGKAELRTTYSIVHKAPQAGVLLPRRHTKGCIASRAVRNGVRWSCIQLFQLQAGNGQI